MGLYLAVFDDEEELDGVEVGSYSDFSAFRNVIVKVLENGAAGSRFPTLILHSDCDGQWTTHEATPLLEELEIISAELKGYRPIPFNSDWQTQVAKTFGIQVNCLYDCFFDIDGEPLLERVISLARLSESKKLPILFQ